MDENLDIYIYETCIYVRSSTIDRRCSCFSVSSDRPQDDRSGLGCRLQSNRTSALRSPCSTIRVTRENEGDLTRS